MVRRGQKPGCSLNPMGGGYPGSHLCAHLKSMSEVYAANLSDGPVKVNLQNSYYLRTEDVIAAQKTADV